MVPTTSKKYTLGEMSELEANFPRKLPKPNKNTANNPSINHLSIKTPSIGT